MAGLLFIAHMSNTNYENNPQLQMANDFLQFTNQNVFLTGKAGTGKTTFLHNLRKRSPKRMIVVAPTGVAAINARGVTIHSFFQLSFGPQIPEEEQKSDPGAGNETARSTKKFSKNKINIIKSLDLLVIDEISMVRADMLDAIDEVLRRYKNRHLPFGGVQLLMIGDLQQLAPIVKDEEWDILREFYNTCFFFSSRALEQSNFVSIELKKIYRQSDDVFIDLLNKVRENRMDAQALEVLNNRFVPNFDPSDEEGYITLSTHNFQSQATNKRKLQQISGKSHYFKAKVEGDFPKLTFPTDERLELKVGAQVMFVKNDISGDRLYYNGKIGKVAAIGTDYIKVKSAEDEDPVIVERDMWENTKYKLDEKTKEIQEEVIGSFKQYPLKLAWAITIHKSQGLTFERAIVDAQRSFAHGQVYVALSRCKSLEGLVLTSRINSTSIINDQTVSSFTHHVENNQPTDRDLSQSRLVYELQLMQELFDFKEIYKAVQSVIYQWSIHRKSFIGNLSDNLNNLLVPFEMEIQKVAENFGRQIHRILLQKGNVNGNVQLQERIMKASDYFIPRFKSIVMEPLVASNFDSDNEGIKENMQIAMEKLDRLVSIKKVCLDSVSEGFSISHYLTTRAKASVNQTAPKPKRKAVKVVTNNPDLYQLLIDWRKAEAKRQETGVGVIVSHNCIVQLANSVPINSVELKKIPGFGASKYKAFGTQIMALVSSYRKSQGLELEL